MPPAESIAHSNGKGAQYNQHANNLHVFHQMHQLMKAQAPLDATAAGQQHSNGITHRSVVPQSLEHSLHVPSTQRVAYARAPLSSGPLLNTPSTQAVHPYSSTSHQNGLQQASHASCVRIPAGRAATEQESLQQQHQMHALGASTLHADVARSVQPTTVTAQKSVYNTSPATQYPSPAVLQPDSFRTPQTAGQQNPHSHGVTSASRVTYPHTSHSLCTGTALLSGQSILHSAAYTSTAAENSEGALQGLQPAAEPDARPVRSKKISIRIKAFRGDRSATPDDKPAANHAAPDVPQQNGVCQSTPAAAAPDLAPKPRAKRKSRSKGTTQGKKQKNGPAHDYLGEAQRLVKGSCARVRLLAQHERSSVLPPSLHACMSDKA